MRVRLTIYVITCNHTDTPVRGISPSMFWSTNRGFHSHFVSNLEASCNMESGSIDYTKKYNNLDEQMNYL